MQKKKPTIYVPLFREPFEPQREILEPAAEIISDQPKSEAEFISILKRVDVILLTSRHRLTRSMLEACPNLRLIGKYGVGVENIDVQAATERGILVTNVPGVISNGVAEFTIGLILALLRQIQNAKELITSGRWEDDRSLERELKYCAIGIVGYGNIAKEVIRKLQGLEVRKILVYTESKSHEASGAPNVQFTDLKALLKESDIVSIHKSLTPRSKGLIGEAELKMMARSAYLINTSRGGLIDEKALIRALQKRWIAGAALDVFEKESLPPDSPLLSLDNVVLTPHLGGSTVEARKGRWLPPLQGIEAIQEFGLGPRY